MDFTKPNQPTGGSHGKSKTSIPFVKIATMVILICASVVLLGMTWLLVRTKTPNEAKNVEKDKLQAVFLNGGQVYFGSISSINNQYMRLNNIYYLRVNQQVQPDQANKSNQDISLVKLGCELHGPEDQMVIKQDQVIFWENLKQDGQVAQAVKKFVQENPNGQKCSTTSDSNSTDTTSTEPKQ